MGVVAKAGLPKTDLSTVADLIRIADEFDFEICTDLGTQYIQNLRVASKAY
jgi:hypothetical protein